ncbi:MAG: SPOCS domain-containing protein [Cellulosilyticaceae bacterium]
MPKFNRSLIEYDGVLSYQNDICAAAIPNSFKQFNIDMELCVPCQKPSIEQIVKITTDTCVTKQVIIRTPCGISAEGSVLTGFKLVAMGEVQIKIKYVALEPEQSVHTVHATIPFCSSVVMPCEFTNLSAVSSKVYVEDAYISQKDDRCMFANVTLMLVAQSC